MWRRLFSSTGSSTAIVGVVQLYNRGDTFVAADSGNRCSYHTTDGLLKARVTSFSPWKQRPGGLQRHSRPQMVHPHHFRGTYRGQNMDDPTQLLSPKHVIVKRCSECKRTLFVKLAEKDYFHTCCEGVPMKQITTMAKVMDADHRLTQTLRQWDVESDRPWSRPHKPKPKGRSKLAKR